MRVNVVIAAMLLCAQALIAQDRPGGIVFGHVVDAVKLPLPGVSVTLTPERGGPSWRTQSDREGNYNFDLLPDGMYRANFELRGFDMVRWRDIRVRVNDRSPSMQYFRSSGFANACAAFQANL